MSYFQPVLHQRKFNFRLYQERRKFPSNGYRKKHLLKYISHPLKLKIYENSYNMKITQPHAYDNNYYLQCLTVYGFVFLFFFSKLSSQILSVCIYTYIYKTTGVLINLGKILSYTTYTKPVLHKQKTREQHTTKHVIDVYVTTIAFKLKQKIRKMLRESFFFARNVDIKKKRFRKWLYAESFCECVYIMNEQNTLVFDRKYALHSDDGMCGGMHIA